MLSYAICRLTFVGLHLHQVVRQVYVLTGGLTLEIVDREFHKLWRKNNFHHPIPRPRHRAADQHEVLFWVNFDNL